MAESAEKYGAALSLAKSIEVMTNAIKGLNGIKEQWAGRTGLPILLRFSLAISSLLHRNYEHSVF